MSLLDWTGGRIFSLIHGNNLVYNTCWEDPRLDRRALALRPGVETGIVPRSLEKEANAHEVS